MMGSLYVVAMPIGNHLDISQRAKNILETVDVIAAEDTRKFRKIVQLSNLNCIAKIYAYHSYNEKNSSLGLIKSMLEENKSVALVYDAGTPRISDPGFCLIRDAWENKIQVQPIPGSSCLTTILSISPFHSIPLLFLGYLSNKKNKKKKQLEEYTYFCGSVVILESVHRIESTLQLLLESWEENTILIGREMTKIYEEYFLGSMKESLEWVKNKKGEFTLLVDNKSKEK